LSMPPEPTRVYMGSGVPKMSSMTVSPFLARKRIAASSPRVGLGPEPDLRGEAKEGVE
jgi:hypothetical protein